MMRYLLYLLFLGCLGFSATWAYRVNYETRNVVRNLKNLQIEIAKQEERLIMLEGEWAYLNRPERLTKLSERFFTYLELMPMSAENFADVEVIRLKAPSELNMPLKNYPQDLATTQFGDQQ
tara:strand:- start:2269 stop:2631 length:363 start_codon:yes stop_codon:yes gene_type:complete